MRGVNLNFGQAAGLTAFRSAGAPILAASNTFDLASFGAVGDGVADDGPALQSALDAIADAGGGTLFVPAGRYAIYTPVQKNFTGLAASVAILGVESSTPVAPPDSSGSELTRGLDLVSEFLPRTGETQSAVSIAGLETLLIEHIVFIGTEGVENDALITLALNDISKATIRHSEFYALSSLVAGGAIIQAVRCDLTFEQSVVLGSACSSGVYSSIIQNQEWKGITIAESIFADYGQRELFGKMTTAPFSWVSIDHAAPVDNESPRREAVIRSVFLDEGGFMGITSLPYEPGSTPIDLIYITGLHMNVSNFGTTGNYLYGTENVLIEKSHYGYSHNAGSAIYLLSVGNAIIDEATCIAHANRIRADSGTGKLIVINSTYAGIDSEAQITDIITTETPEEDPVQDVRQQFAATLGRAPDAAAHSYWSHQILQCKADMVCADGKRAALAAYLATAPSAHFNLSGRVTAENGTHLAGATITLSGSQSVTTTTNSAGHYHFSHLPTSGSYTLAAAKTHYTFNSSDQLVTTPSGDQTVDFTSALNRHSISGSVADTDGNPVAGVTISVSGAQNATTTTGVSGNFSFDDLPAGGDYTVNPSLQFNSFTPASWSVTDLGATQQISFVGTLNTHTLSGQVTNFDGAALSGVTAALSGPSGLISTLTSGADGNFSFGSLPAGVSYMVIVSKADHVFNPASRSFSPLGSNQIANFSASPARIIEFDSIGFSAAEGTATTTITVKRSGDASAAASVIYTATNGTANQGKDVGTVIGLLTFPPGESTQTFPIAVTDDAFVEGVEHLTVSLTNPQGAALGSRASATVTIDDNDTAPNSNPIDEARFFVRQHYRDFLNREPDAAGLDFWSNQILDCGDNVACVENRRVNVSAAFFLSIEFQETGFLVYRAYRASFAQPPQFQNQFLLDARTISQGVVVDAPGWQQLLENNKTAYLKKFVERPEFENQYPLNLTPTEFVNLLNGKAGNPLASEGASAAIAEFNGSATSADTTARARVLRLTAENATFTQREISPAFVLMQYFGYLQRNPSDPPDINLEGYNFWLSKLNQFGGDFHSAQMVTSFLVAGEYRSRFGH